MRVVKLSTRSALLVRPGSPLTVYTVCVRSLTEGARRSSPWRQAYRPGSAPHLAAAAPSSTSMPTASPEATIMAEELARMTGALPATRFAC